MRSKVKIVIYYNYYSVPRSLRGGGGSSSNSSSSSSGNSINTSSSSNSMIPYALYKTKL
jgi:hypothetical protein